MRAEHLNQRQTTVVQGKPIEDALRRAVRHALLEHKRAGNPIAVWKDGQVVLIPPEEIEVEDNSRPNSE
jgi:hypothetical protein